MHPGHGILLIIYISVAGSDTTSTSVQSTLLYIVTNPTVYDTLRSEIRGAVEKGDISSPIQDAEAKQLVYLQACVLEGLRKFPPLSQLRERVVPPGGDVVGRFRLPGGTFVGLNAWGVQLSKAVYGDDADLYRPERWLTDDVHKLQLMYQTHSLIFGHGSTRCLGVSMAMLEITKVIFEVNLCHYHLAPGERVRQIVLTLTVNSPLAPQEFRHHHCQSPQTMGQSMLWNFLPEKLQCSPTRSRFYSAPILRERYWIRPSLDQYSIRAS